MTLKRSPEHRGTVNSDINEIHFLGLNMGTHLGQTHLAFSKYVYVCWFISGLNYVFTFLILALCYLYLCVCLVVVIYFHVVSFVWLLLLFMSLLSSFSHNIYVVGLLFSRP